MSSTPPKPHSGSRIGSDGIRSPGSLSSIAATSGNLDRARAALEAVATMEEAATTSASSAEVARARAELSWAEGDLESAETHFRAAVSDWIRAGAPVHAAHVRLRLFELLEQGDPSSGELELSAAESVFTEVGTDPLIRTCQSLRARLG